MAITNKDNSDVDNANRVNTKNDLFEVLKRRKKTVLSYLEDNAIVTSKDLAEHLVYLKESTDYYVSEKFLDMAEVYLSKTQPKEAPAAVPDVEEITTTTSKTLKQPSKSKQKTAK